MTLPILALLLTMRIMIPGGTILSTSTTKTIVSAEATTPPSSLMIFSPDPVTFVPVHCWTFAVVVPSSMMVAIMAWTIILLPFLLHFYYSLLLLVAHGYKIIYNERNNGHHLDNTICLFY